MLSANKGFTLAELLVVIVIISILSALAIPKMTAASDKAKWTEVPSVLAAYENAQLAHMIENMNLGAVGDLIFDAPEAGDSKWFTYSVPGANGTYQGVVKAGKGSIGGLAAGQGCGKAVQVINNSGVVTHTAQPNDDATKTSVKKMCSNFLP
jgi:prepilin-type N-terminal cleavage/methylation domain-containing protein